MHLCNLSVTTKQKIFKTGFIENKMDKNIMEYVYGLEVLVGTGIVGFTIGKLTEKISDYIQKKICKGWEKYYEENLHEITIVEVEKERGRNGHARSVNYPEHAVEYAKRHHKKRDQLRLELECRKAIYRAELSRTEPYIEMPQISGLLE